MFKLFTGIILSVGVVASADNIPANAHVCVFENQNNTYSCDGSAAAPLDNIPGNVMNDVLLTNLSGQLSKFSKLNYILKGINEGAYVFTK